MLTTSSSEFRTYKKQSNFDSEVSLVAQNNIMQNATNPILYFQSMKKLHKILKYEEVRHKNRAELKTSAPHFCFSPYEMNIDEY